MPTFCRHNRLLQNCPICTKEQNIEMRPAVTRFGESEQRAATGGSRAASGGSRVASAPHGRRVSGPRGRAAGAGSGGMTVRRLARAVDDGFQSSLVPGLRSAADARRLADELALAETRCLALAQAPFGLYAELADDGVEIEQRSWLAFEIAWLSPLEGDEDPFAAIAAARVPWEPEGDAVPDAELARCGPRGTWSAATAARTAAAYGGWVRRAGSQAAAYAGEPSWTPERRFDRVFERLSLHGLDRAVRFDLLVTLGGTGLYELRAGSLHLGGGDPVTVAAKRILGIGDPMLLDRRAAELASACGVSLQALDLGFFNWERGERYNAGLPAGAEPDEDVRAAARAAFGLDAGP
ncbi:MAG TPA: hypothetical protein VFW09_09015 [Solirubrobacteraceae bacterium]|nr:hypothetical protein [Solirubrobacteraceae bacterium]